MNKLLIHFSAFLSIQFTLLAQSGWFQQTSGTTNQLNSVFFVDADNGWAVGDSGTILKTTNGGVGWNTELVGVTENISCVQFTDNLTGWIMTQDWNNHTGTLLKTTNQGEDWDIAFSDSQSILHAFYFVNNDTGWVSSFNLNTAGHLYKTTNGGLNWQIQVLPGYIYKDIFFVDSYNGWMIGTWLLTHHSWVWNTTDGGVNWIQIDLPSPHYDPGVNSIYFVDGETGWLTRGYLGDAPGGFVAKTTDGGYNWPVPPQTYANTDGGFCDVFFTDTSTGWVVGGGTIWGLQSGGEILCTTNGGLDWTQQYFEDQRALTSVYFVDSYTGWAVGSSGIILKTTTGGLVSDTIHVPSDYSTIQAGINAANNGDVVIVADGTYYENINYRGKAITVASHFLLDGDRMHIENTIINGSTPVHPDSGSVITFNSGEDTTSVLCGFTINGGTGTQWSADYRLGGGIYIYGSPIIRENIIENNEVMSNSNSWGSAIYAQTYQPDRTCVIENNIIRNNLSQPLGSSNNGAGAVQLYYDSPSTIIIRNNSIYNNVVTGKFNLFGGGVDALTQGNNSQYLCIIENNKIYGNTVDNTPGSSIQRGGGIYIEDVGATIIRNNIIAYNTAPFGGGIYFRNHFAQPQAVPIIENNTIFGNTATGGHSGAITTDEPFDILNCIIWGNSSPQYYGSSATITYSNLEESYPNGSNNIFSNPEIVDTTYFLISNTSPCIDAGNPDPMFNDLEDPLNPGNPMPPAQGTLVNDMGHCGGPHSVWGYWTWPIPVELTSFTASISSGKVTLNWSTATESNNSGFEIERKQNELRWERLGFVEGHGTTTEPQTYSFTDDIRNNSTYSLAYRLKQIDLDGSFEYSDVAYVDNLVPAEFTLYQNFPNPFNPTTTIEYSLPVKTKVELIIYNSLGEEVVQLVNEVKEPGNHTVEFNASTLSSSIYFYKLQSGDFIQTKKMILLK